MKVVVERLQDFPPGERRIVNAGVRSVGVFRVDDRFYALRNLCPHQGGPLCRGRVAPWIASAGPGDMRTEDQRMLIACPWHGWEYDLETGQSFMGPGETRVKAYEVAIEPGSAIAAQLDAPGGRAPGPYRAETFPVYVEDDFVVVEI